MSQLPLLNDLLEHAPDHDCRDCVEAWGPYRVRVGARPGFVPSGWVLLDGRWQPPWGVANDGHDAQRARLAAADRMQLARDLTAIGVDP